MTNLVLLLFFAYACLLSEHSISTPANPTILTASDNTRPRPYHSASAHRPFKMWRHKLGAETSDDTLLFEEKDPMFWLGMWKSKSGRLVFAASGSSETSEAYFIDMKGVSQEISFGLRDCMPNIETIMYVHGYSCGVSRFRCSSLLYAHMWHLHVNQSGDLELIQVRHYVLHSYDYVLLNLFYQSHAMG